MKKFTVTDYKGCRHIDLSPTGRLAVIAGGNGAGKSSFIDAITELFDPKGSKLTPVPIREGADEARAEYFDDELGLRISRVWKKNGTAGTLAVEALDGAKYSKPSEVVASLLGGAIFDPVAFLNLDEKRQRDALLAKVDVPVDLDALAREKAGAEGRRLDAGREVKRLQGALSTLTAPAPDAPTEEVSAQAILAEVQEAQDTNRRFEDVVRADAEAARKVEDIEAEIARLQASLAVAQAEKERTYRVRCAVAGPVDLEPLRARLAAVDETNARVRAAREYFATAAALARAEEAHGDAQAEIEGVEAEKRVALAQASFPVDGLSVDDEGVTFNGIPFGQVNTAMRRRIAFAIATAGDPKLRLVIVKDGDLLDAESLQAIADLAEDCGYTVLVERDRDESRRIGFTVRDGVLESEAV